MKHQEYQKSPRQERHTAKSAMHRARNKYASEIEPDLDSLEPANGRSMHSQNHHNTPPTHNKGALEGTASGVGKVWKLKFWKRRSSMPRI